MRKLKWKPTPENDTLPLLESCLLIGVIAVVFIIYCLLNY